MQNFLSIKVLSEYLNESICIEYFNSIEWNQESEAQFLSKIQELFSLIRNHSSQLNLEFKVKTNNINYLSFILNKKKNNKVEINHSKLSLREIEVLGCIMQGLTNLQIAERLFISFETVRSHRKNILEKTGAKNTACLVNYYHQTFFEK